MKFFKKLFNRGKLEDGSYMLQSYWTAADSVEFNDEKTLEEYKSDTNTKIQGKGDHLYYDADNKTLCLLSGETVISSTEIENSGTSTEVIGDVTDVSVTPVDFTVEIKWTDPQDTENIEWGGTTVVRKKNSRPVDCLDGTVVVETTTRDQYKTSAFVDEDIDSNSSYYYRFFPYSTGGAIRSGKAVLVKTNIDNSIVYDTPTIKGTYTYTGSEQNVELENFNEDKMVLSYGSATNAGVYTPTITLKEGYRWQDKTTTPLELTWVIEKAVVSTIPTQSGTITYTGTERTPSWSNFDANKLNISGTTSATNAGEYTAIFTPTSNYKWQDNTSTAKNATWTIGRATISTLPSQSGTAEYTGSTVTPTWSGYDTSKMTISGQTSGVDAGNYIAVFTPTSNYKWSDDTTGGKEVTWVITNQSISTVPTQSGTLTYNGNLQTPTWNNYDTNKLTVSVTSQTNAGTYNATFTPKTGYKWSDGTTSGKSASWTIDRATIATVPTVASSPTYNGSSQSPTWNNYDTSKMTIGGTYSSINAGTFTATFTPTSNYKWSDGSTSAKNVSWTMNKATQTLTLSSSTATVNAGSTTTVTASGNTGSLSVSTSNSSYATASVSGSTVTISGVAAGSATITVTAASTTNYYSVSKTVSVTVNGGVPSYVTTGITVKDSSDNVISTVSPGQSIKIKVEDANMANYLNDKYGAGYSSFNDTWLIVNLSQSAGITFDSFTSSIHIEWIDNRTVGYRISNEGARTTCTFNATVSSSAQTGNCNVYMRTRINGTYTNDYDQKIGTITIS